MRHCELLTMLIRDFYNIIKHIIRDFKNIAAGVED